MRLAPTNFGGPEDADWLLLGPSLGTSVQALWQTAASQLTDRFRVVGWDLPGHGASSPAAGFDVPALARGVLALADELGAANLFYAGNSLGGVVGLQLLLDAPDRLNGATLLCTGARIGEPADWLERAAKVRASGTVRLLDVAPTRWFGPRFGEREPTRVQVLRDDLVAADDESYASACDAIACFDARDRLADIATPILAVAGEHDRVTTIHTLQEIGSGVQRGRTVCLPGVAHLVPAEAPTKVAELISSVAADPPGSPTTARVRAEGMKLRREVLGDAHVDRALQATTEFTEEFQQLITQYAWGSIWTRPGLDRRTRSMITLTILVARGHHEEVAMHVRAAFRNGVTVGELKELLLQTAIYCGVPEANAAFRIAQQVIETVEEAP